MSSRAVPDALPARRSWAPVGAVVLAAALLPWWPQPLRDVPVAPVRVQPAVLAQAASGGAPAQVVPLRAAAVPVPRPAPVRRRIAAEAPDTEVCGFGAVALADDDPFGVQRIPRTVRGEALDTANALMLGSADEQVRAAALLIGARSGDGAAPRRLDRLARMAAGSADPIVYAMAVEGCRSMGADDAGACRLLSRAQWARLDPDNAVPWLELAGEAREHDEPAAEAEAMYRAAQARRSDVHAGLLPRLVERAFGQGGHSLARTLALAASWSVQAAWSAPPSNQAFRYCSIEAVQDSNRHRVCSALADTLAYRGDSLLDLSVAAAMASLLHWPDEQLQALQNERDALGDAGRFQGPPLDLSCGSVEQLQAWMQRVGERGETGAARELVLASGATIEQRSLQNRRNLALAAEAADAAASAALP